MPCIIALIIFGIMGLFSATHRELASEALRCVFRKITFRPCQTGFQDKIKGRLLSKILVRSPLGARLVNRYYVLLSWAFSIVLVGSGVWLFWGLFNYYVYGSCNGLNQSGFCALDLRDEANRVSAAGQVQTCRIDQRDDTVVSLAKVDLSTFAAEDIGAEDSVVFVGSYICDYTRRAYPTIQRLLRERQVNYTFAHFPNRPETEFWSGVGYCVFKQDPKKFWQLNDYLFTADKSYISDRANLEPILNKFGLDAEKITACAASRETQDTVLRQLRELSQGNVFGTPTVFINGRPFIGPKPFRVYRSAVNDFIFF